MLFDPTKVPGVGELVWIDINKHKNVYEKFDELFKNVDRLSHIFCAVAAELQDAYRIWGIYGLPYTSDINHLPGVGRKEPADLLALWTEVLTTRTVRLTDKYKESVSVLQFLELDLDPNLKKEIETLINIAKDKTKPLRTARDKFYAHKDLDVVEGKTDILNPGFTIHDIADILELVDNILRCIYIHFSGKDDTGFTAYYDVHDPIEY